MFHRKIFQKRLVPIGTIVPINSISNPTLEITSENQLTHVAPKTQTSEQTNTSASDDQFGLAINASFDDLFCSDSTLFKSTSKKIDDLLPSIPIKTSKQEQPSHDFSEYTVVQVNKGLSPYEEFQKQAQLFPKPFVSSSDINNNYGCFIKKIKELIGFYVNQYAMLEERTAAILEEGNRVLGNISSDSQGHIFVQTEDVKESVNIFLQSFFAKEENCNLMNAWEAKKKAEYGSGSPACIAFVKAKITTNSDEERYFCFVSVSSLGKAEQELPKMLNPTVTLKGKEFFLWSQLEEVAEMYNKQVFINGLNNSQNPLYIILDGGSALFSKAINRGLEAWDPNYDRHVHLPNRECAEKAFISTLAKVEFQFKQNAKITGALTAQFTAKENLNAHGHDVLFSIKTGENKTISVFRQPLCPHCQRNKLPYIISMLAAKELAEHPGKSARVKRAKQGREGFPSPFRGSGCDYLIPLTYGGDFFGKSDSKKRKETDNSEFLSCNSKQDGTMLKKQCVN